MERNSRIYQNYVRILKEELIPAMGCTEPIAIAYASAKAREVLTEIPDHVEIEVSPNIIKNVKAVVVPNTNGLKGIASAAAAGIIGGDASKRLEVIASVTEEDKQKMKKFLEEAQFTIRAVESGIVFDIIVALSKGEHSSLVRIAQYHTNIVRIEKDHEVLFDEEGGQQEKKNQDVGLADKSLLNIHDILDFADTCAIEDIRPILDPMIECNGRIAEEGLKNNWGANIGSTLLKFNGNDVKWRAIAKAAAGSDARMSGCELPVIINSGSGNQGITASVPLMEYAAEIHATKEKLYRSLAVSNLIAIHEKTGIGVLSAYCGAVSAGCAAGAGIAYLCGGDENAVNHTLVNSLVIVSGIICDGAKPSCAAKIASAVQAGIFGYEMWQNGQQFRYGEGIVNSCVESTITNVARLGREGMAETDKEIVRIMLDE